MPLEEVMVAMDVVDTLRHQQDIAERELDTSGRRQRLLDRLKDIYKAQGIDVPDHVLEQGIDALEQERFQYQAVDSSWATRLAHIWVSRSRWGKPIGFLAVVATMFTSVYVVKDVLPERELRSSLPSQIEKSLSNIQTVAKNPLIVDQAKQQSIAARQALADDDLQQAKHIVSDMREVNAMLKQQYTIRVVSQPNELSGIWRVPEVNSDRRNYYLIVEAIDVNNKTIELNVLNEETNKRVKKSKWGLRVNEQTFYKIAQDKKDDGIIQANKVGHKPVGYLQPQFTIPTTGATITDW